MPVWAGYLTPDQVKDLVSYIRVISHTAPQP
jgi:mono/diheme cytochrome c family protein